MVGIELPGRTGVVTGAGSGMGREIALFLSSLGAEVILADINRAAADETEAQVRAAGGKATAVTCDVASSSGLDEVTAMVDSNGQTLDFLVNNAAVYAELRPTPLEALDSEEWDRVQSVNVRGMWNCSRRLLPALSSSEHGRIVNIASAIAFRGSPLALHYVTSKAAVIGMTRAMARELGDRKITVNAVAPGFTWTRSSLDKIDDPTQLDAQIARRSLKRPQLATDVIGAVAFFCSDLASYITGQTLVVDGGSHMH